MSSYVLVVERVPFPALVIHGGAGAYLKTTSEGQRLERGRLLADIVTRAHGQFASGAQAAVLHAIRNLEQDPTFNAGYGSRLQKDGRARLSAALMDGAAQRMSAVFNVQDCLHPSELTEMLQHEGDRNLDGEGARLLMEARGIEPTDVRTATSLARWRKLLDGGDHADREAAIGSAGEDELELARKANLPLPDDLAGSSGEDRHGTVGAVGGDESGQLWACTSTGGRGHEAVGRVSDSPTVAGNYACPVVALSATGFGEQIIDLNVCGRIATRMLDGADLETALGRTFDEVAAFGGLLGVIAVARDGTVGYAHTTEACGVAWFDGAGQLHVDQHGRGQRSP
jgi:L-asparaginase